MVRHTLVYGSGYVATAALSLILLPVYTHYLSPSEFGLLALMLVLYGVGKQIYDLGFTNSVARFFFDSVGGDLRRMRTTSLAFLAAYGGLLTAGLMIFAGDFARLFSGTPRNADLVRIVAVTMYAEALAIVPLTLIRMQERSGLFVLITIVRLIAAVGLSIVFITAWRWEVHGALLANAIPAVGVAIALLFRHPGRLLGRFSWDLLRKMLVFGLPFFPVLLAGWVIDASDRLVLEAFRNRDEVGFYSLAYRYGQVMQIAVAAFAMGWAPLRYRIYERLDAKQLYCRITHYYVVIASLLGVTLSVFAHAIVAVISPASYAPAGRVAPIIVLAYVMQGLYFLMATGMGVTKKTAPMAWVAGLGAAVNIALNLLVVPRWGMTGAACTTVGSYVIMVAGTWMYSQRVYSIPYDWQSVAKVFSTAITVVGVTVAVSPADVVAASLCGIVAVLAFCTLLMMTGTVSHVDRSAAKAWIRVVRRQRRNAREKARP